MNEVTAEAQRLFLRSFDNLAPDWEGWVRRAAEESPAKAAEIVLKLAEFHLPKRSAITVNWKEAPPEVILAELERQEAEEAGEDPADE